LKTRLTLTSFDLVENVDYRRRGRGQGILFTPTGTEKILKKRAEKILNWYLFIFCLSENLIIFIVFIVFIKNIITLF